jgi:asparagine synthase (glutamine-hydrolysing)
MCGIAGFWHFDSDRQADIGVLKQMTDSMKYRGPDGSGYVVNKNLAFGHRRLSIIDLASGEQPMFNLDKSIALIFNGEIYNYIEIREELMVAGYQFTTASDSEVIIKAYEHWGVDCQNKFNGMWAFALWDNKKQLLLLSRDRIGEKPLHYAIYDDTLIFGSEIKSIIKFGVPKQLDTSLFEIYFSLGYIPAPYTFYKNIKKLKAGCYITTQKGKQVQECKYWDLPEIDENRMLVKEKEIYENFDNLFHDSVRIRMRSDVPYGAFLSGGLDSSSVVASMSEISSFPVETFTIGFKEKYFDERDLARKVATVFNTNHHEYLIEPDSFEESLNNIAFHYDEPFGDSSAIPTGHVSRFASSKVKMVLTGDGGDEVLSGYTMYQGEKFASQYGLLPKWAQSAIPLFLSIASKPLRHSLRYKFNRAEEVCNSSRLNFQNRFLAKAASVDLNVIKNLVKSEHVYPIEEYLSDFLKGCTYKDTFYQLMYLNLKLSLPDDMLTKVDRMSMAYSLETRTPFLDFRLIDYLAHVHKDVKMKKYERKTILKQTIGKKLPESILNAPKKGFGPPLREWFKDDSFNYYQNNLKQSPILNHEITNEIIKMNKAGKKDYGNFIWMLIILNEKLNDRR